VVNAQTQTTSQMTRNTPQLSPLSHATLHSHNHVWLLFSCFAGSRLSAHLRFRVTPFHVMFRRTFEGFERWKNIYVRTWRIFDLQNCTGFLTSIIQWQKCGCIPIEIASFRTWRCTQQVPMIARSTQRRMPSATSNLSPQLQEGFEV
jgi:hypothetical protein